MARNLRRLAALLLCALLPGLARARLTAFSIVKDFQITDAEPNGNLVLAGDGRVYGITRANVLYSVSPGGSGYAESKISTDPAANGDSPTGIAEGPDGRIYGTMLGGGASDLGTIFAVAKNGTGFTVLHAFTGGATDGGAPQAGPIFSGGKLIGDSTLGGASNQGTFFTINPDGSDFHVIKSGSTADGRGPQSPPVADASGNLYGTCQNGGTSDDGTVFTIHADGTGFTVLHSFDFTHGTNPGGLTLASDGALYGVAYQGGSAGSLIYRIRPDGTGFTVLHELTVAEGQSLTQPLVEGRDGRLYGAAASGGEGNGTLFRVNRDGTGFEVLRALSSADGELPFGPLVETAPGVFFGTAEEGGAGGWGTLFRFVVAPDPSPTPVVAVSGKKKIATATAARVVRGRASDLGGTLARIEVKVGKARYKKAAGLVKWKFTAHLKPGRNVILVRAVDVGGAVSRPVKRIVIRTRP